MNTALVIFGIFALFEVRDNQFFTMVLIILAFIQGC